MNKILIAGNEKTDLNEIANITVADGKFVSVSYDNGRTVRYLYNPHFDIDCQGRTELSRRMNGR